jgi:hypothetical protein
MGRGGGIRTRGAGRGGGGGAGGLIEVGLLIHSMELVWR